MLDTIMQNLPHQPRRGKKKKRKGRQRDASTPRTVEQRIRAAAEWLNVPIPKPRDHRRRQRLSVIGRLAERIRGAVRDDVLLAADLVVDKEMNWTDACQFVRAQRPKQPDDGDLPIVAQRLKIAAPRAQDGEVRRIARRVVNGEISESAARLMLGAPGQGGNVTTFTKVRGGGA